MLSLRRIVVGRDEVDTGIWFDNKSLHPVRRLQTGDWFQSYTIIPTDPNELMEPIHNRMPITKSL
jgi:putative SOS response-associated peptidase YedK